ncbi:MAG: hypothetical protein V8Q43_00290 [Christensenellaceae bacterium]
MTRTRKAFFCCWRRYLCCRLEGSEEISAIQQAGKLRVLTSAEFPPYEYHDADRKAVARIWTWRRASSRLGVELEVVDETIPELFVALLNGRG